MIASVPPPDVPPSRPTRSETRQTTELKALRDRRPELADAVNMHLELLELERRIQGRVPLPFLDLTETRLARHAEEGRPLLRFEDIPLELTDLRLTVRQTAEILQRFGAIDEADSRRIQSLGRDMKLLEVVGDWYRSTVDQRMATVTAHATPVAIDASVEGMVGQVLTQAMRPFLSRCAEVLQQRPELTYWTHPYCALCGGEPDFAVITASGDRQLCCSRCTLRWRFDPIACPYCRNSDRTRLTSFGTADGVYRVYACDACHRYLKAFDSRRSTRPMMLIVDGVATLPLDAAAIQRGYSS
jgi:FdhE protein